MNFGYYYMIGLPVGISLALLTDLGATGMWTGLLVAVFLTVRKEYSCCVHVYRAKIIVIQYSAVLVL